MQSIFSTPVLIRNLWQLKTVVFLHWCLICAVQLVYKTNLSPSLVAYFKVTDILKNTSFLCLLRVHNVLQKRPLVWLYLTNSPSAIKATAHNGPNLLNPTKISKPTSSYPLHITKATVPNTLLRSGKTNWREPKTGWGLVFNFKLGCFDDVCVFIYAEARPHLQLKTQPRFSPFS